jgi:nitroreductase/NAD-dependent dihydropyrimidine dehydrogenase PreA subunit
LNIKGIDTVKCIKCEECIKECPAHLFYAPLIKVGEEKKVVFSDEFNFCILCGHCIAVCPTDAIVYENEENALEFETIKDASQLISYETLQKFLRSRRSIRRYKNEQVSKSDLDRVLDAMRYAPTAMNAQAWRFLIISDPARITLLRNAVIYDFIKMRSLIKIGRLFRFLLPKTLRKVLNDPRTKMRFDYYISSAKSGKDLIFHNAPSLIFVYSPRYGNMAPADAAIAFAYGMLAAHSIGLGTCWIGYAHGLMMKSKKLNRLFQIPKNMTVHGVLTIGYPKVRYYRVPPRNKIRSKSS